MMWSVCSCGCGTEGGIEPWVQAISAASRWQCQGSL